MKPQTLRCAIYTRKSTEEGLDQDFNSLHAQRQACEAYVLSQAGEGWSALPQAYDDGGFSGGSMDRPALRSLMDDISRGKVDIVVVYKVDRLTRSLADFAKIVELFDGKGVSFVSVTQAFNTTSSMGRLTLNVLLSFAQFEREVTGERIRDKIAASKAKGMWMGGRTPLGYVASGRTLKIDEIEAETVRHIFRRYLKLGSVHDLRDDLTAAGIVAKRRVSKRGTVSGGGPFGRGALFHLLQSRVYLGEIPHKDQSYPGLHPAIVDPETFDAVQARLTAAAVKRSKPSGRPGASNLTGRVFDDRGHPMSPTATARGARRYRYYVSAALLKGQAKSAGSLARAPAGDLEALVIDRATKLGLVRDAENPWPEVLARLRRVEVGEHHIRMKWSWLQGRPTPGQTELTPTDQVALVGDRLTMDCHVTLQRRGGSKAILGPGGQSAIDRPRQPDPALVKALIRAESFRARLVSDGGVTMAALAKQERIRACYLQRLVRLAFLSPSIKRAILDGTAPETLTLQRLMERGVEDVWSTQLASLISQAT